VRSALKIAEETKTDLTEEQKEIVKSVASNTIQYELAKASEYADSGKLSATCAIRNVLDALKIAEETKTDLTKKQKEMIESIASDTIQYELAKASEYANSDESLRADAVLSLLYALKIAEETGTHFTEKQAEMAVGIMKRLSRKRFLLI
jgi:hypothetical protein